MALRITDYPNYTIDEFGRIISHQTSQPKVKTNWVNTTGYPTVHLYNDDGRKTLKVHRLVYQMYSNEGIPLTFDINHKDGNKLNCNVSNLEPSNHQHNALHALDIGVNSNHTENHCRALLTNEQVQIIKSTYIARDSRFGGAALAAKFGVTPQAISHIVTGVTWNRLHNSSKGTM